MKQIIIRGHHAGKSGLKAILGSLTRWRTISEFNHLSVRMGNDIFEADVMKGFIVSRKIRKDITVELELSVEEEHYYRYLRYLESQVGSSYDGLAIFSFMFNLRLQNKNKLYCSEIVKKLFEIMHLDMKIRKNISSPEDSINIIRGIIAGQEYLVGSKESETKGVC